MRLHLSSPYAGMNRPPRLRGEHARSAGHTEPASSLALSPTMRARVSRRKAILALCHSGLETKAVALFIDCSVSTVRRLQRHSTGVEDLTDRPRTGRPALYTNEVQTRVIAFYCQTQPLPDCGKWTFHWAALHLKAHPEKIGVAPSRATIYRILDNHGLKPHQSRYFLHITDPEFFPKMEHLLALYQNPPHHLFFFDECPGIQVLKRLTPDLRTEVMKKRLEEFEYIRNGTMDVFAFLHHADGKVYTECHRDHTTTTFLEVFSRHVGMFQGEEPLHYVMDNLSSHSGFRFCQTVAELSEVDCPSEGELNTQTKRIEWLRSEEKRIVVHYTPCHGSWLNLVEIWFRILGAAVFNESFCSPDAFKAAYEAFVEEWNCLLAHPFHWSYEGKGLHEKAVKRFTKMLHRADQLETRIFTKGLMLMTNLLQNYFSNVQEDIWNLLAETVALQHNTIMTLIHNEDGPKRRKKAEEAFTIFTATLNRCYGEPKRKVA
jgi:transposase